MKKLLLSVAVMAQIYLIMPLATFAVTAVPSGLANGAANLDVVGQAGTGTNSGSLTRLLSNGINVVLGLLGIFFIAMFIYAGYLYLTDMGGGENVKKAKKLLGTAIIGAVLIIAAYAISSYVLGALTSVVA